jgi:hypothetical protein
MSDASLEPVDRIKLVGAEVDGNQLGWRLHDRAKGGGTALLRGRARQQIFGPTFPNSSAGDE